MSVDQLERARRVCLSLPETTEQVAWGEPTWRVRKKIFAMFAANHHKDGRIALWVPAPLGVQEALVHSEPEKFFRPPYVGPSGWVGMVLERCDDDELEGQVVQAYCMIAPKKLQALVADRG